MQRLSQIDVAKAVVRSPSRFYDEFEQIGNSSFPLVYAAGAAVLTGVIVGLLMLVIGAAVAEAVLFSLIVGMLLFGGFVVQTALTHSFVYLFGGRGISRTVEAMAYPTVWTLPLSWVPLLGLIIGLFGLWLQAVGISKFHGISRFRALAAVLLGAFAPLLVILALVVVVGTFVLGLGSTIPA